MDTKYFKQKLLTLRGEIIHLTQQVDAAAQTVELDQNRVGRLSRMDAIQGQAMAKASSQRQLALLKSIESALNRIDDGSYGRCLSCDDLIVSGRLEIDPTAPYCVACASAQE